MSAKHQFERLDAAELARLCAEIEPETLLLDFKRVDQTRPFESRDDKQNLAKALSGFANSDGGLIIWGIDARPERASRALHPIQNGKAARERLESLTSDAVNPSVVGVRHKEVAVDGGFVLATLVPASDRPPHRAKCGLDHYFKRSGDSFVRMEHYELEDMFGRRRRPALQVQARTDGARVTICLVNTGRGIAKFPFVHMQIAPQDQYQMSSFGVDGNGRWNLRPLYPMNHSWTCSVQKPLKPAG